METNSWLSRHLEDLLAFHAVAMGGSFTQAAENLGSSKANLSKQVQRIEAVLGVQLLIRTTRALQVTDAGKMLLEYTAKIHELTGEATNRLSNLKAGTAGRIRITAPVSLGRWCFPELAKYVRKALPGLVLDTDVSNEPIDFRTDEVDFAIRGTEVEDPDLVARYLGKLRDVIVCTPKVSKTVDVRDPRKLVEADCIVSSLVTSWNAWTLISKDEEIRIEVPGKLVANEYATMIELVLADLGVARLPYHAVEDELSKGRLVQLFPKYAIGTHPLYLVYRKGNYHPRYHREVRDWLMKWFGANDKVFLK